MVALDKDRGQLSKLSAHFLASLKVNSRQFGRWEVEELLDSNFGIERAAFECGAPNYFICVI